MTKMLAAAFAATTLLASPALAQSQFAPVNPGNNDGKADLSIIGKIALSCTVSPDERTVQVDLDSTDAQTAGSLTYKCNGANGFTRTIKSANGGRLNGPANSFVPYTVSHSGGSGIAISTPVSLATTYTNSLSSSAAFVNGQTGQLRLIAAKPATATDGNPLFAGTYTDTIVVSIAAN
ncbi:hypothetical protein [Sphingomonas panaciterrae]|jgi:hypothetical protein|uniref:hypothetical protein n=1 Tax=Sphingomonas panaciterrae TaxID=1462999 RepID=UPI002FF01A43